MSDNTPAAKPAKLEDQIRQACRVRHYSLATERIYVGWYKAFIRWADRKHPATLSGDRVQAAQNPPPQGVPVRVRPWAPGGITSKSAVWGVWEESDGRQDQSGNAPKSDASASRARPAAVSASMIACPCR